jgi:hypothetical protein
MHKSIFYLLVNDKEIDFLLLSMQIHGSRVVGRRYKQFDWLHEQLMNKFRFVCIPPLPGKQIGGRHSQVKFD